MSLAAPIALALAGLALPIVLFYVLKVRLRREPVSTTIFWRRIYEEKSPRSLWQRMRHWVSLLAQLLLLALLVFALAQPYLVGEATQPRRVVLILDDSASMRAADASPTRLDAAKEIARSAVAGLRSRDEMAVVAAGTQPRVVCGLTGHERTLREAIDRIEPTHGVTAVPQAIAMARRLLGDAPHGEIVVVSDGRFDGAEQLAADPKIDLRVVGSSAANAAIVRFQVRRSLVDPIGYVALVEASNFSDEPVERRLEIDLDDSPVDVFPLKLAPGETWSKTIEKVSVDGGRLVARLRGEDALATDDQAAAILPARQRQRVVLVSDANLFLRMAFAANPLVDLESVATPPETFDEEAIYVFHRTVPQDSLPRRSFFVDPAEASPLWTIGGELEDPLVAEQDDESPLMQHVRLDNVSFPKARKLTPAEGAVALAKSVSDDPLLFVHEAQGRQALVLTVNLEEGDLAFRTAFPILVANSLGWFAGESGELRRSLACGEVADVALPSNDSGEAAPRFAVVSPSGKTLLLPSGAERATFGPIDEAGIWRVAKLPADALAEPGEKGRPDEEALRQAATSEAAEIVQEVAANLASREESDLRVPESLVAGAPATPLAASLGGWLDRPVWLWLATSALGLFAAEWFLYQRRWIG